MAYQAKWERLIEDVQASGSMTLNNSLTCDYQDAFAGRTSLELQEAYMALDGSAREKLVFVATRVLDTTSLMTVLKNTCFYAEAIWDIEAQAQALSAFQITQANERAKAAEAQVANLHARIDSIAAVAKRWESESRDWSARWEQTNEKYIALVDALRLVGFNPQV